jgi:hypothetical protein
MEEGVSAITLPENRRICEEMSSQPRLTLLGRAYKVLHHAEQRLPQAASSIIPNLLHLDAISLTRQLLDQLRAREYTDPDPVVGRSAMSLQVSSATCKPE